MISSLTFNARVIVKSVDHIHQEEWRPADEVAEHHCQGQLDGLHLGFGHSPLVTPWLFGVLSAVDHKGRGVGAISGQVR